MTVNYAQRRAALNLESPTSAPEPVLRLTVGPGALIWQGPFVNDQCAGDVSNQLHLLRS